MSTPEELIKAASDRLDRTAQSVERMPAGKEQYALEIAIAQAQAHIAQAVALASLDREGITTWKAGRDRS